MVSDTNSDTISAGKWCLTPLFSRHLGALAFFLFVACVASGVYLYAVFDTSLAGAYDSGRALDAGVAGSLLRGVHRYSADGFMLATAAHLVRELWRRHFHAYRAWSWLTGLALVPMAWIAGITGFWLAWDARALASVLATAEWVAAWPVHSAAFARNFLVPEAMNDRFFSLAVFLHIGVPLFTLAATWAHVQRLSRVRMWPAPAMAWASGAALVALAILRPATSAAPADLFAVPAIDADYFYFFPHALARLVSPEGLWAVVALGAVLLAALPWIARRPLGRAAVVDLANCNGCARCVDDCPFAAVTMVPRTDGRNHPRQAQVDPGLCAACGICAGACPSSTPFRRRAPLVSGIDLPDLPVAGLRAQLDAHLANRPGTPAVFRCQPGVALARGRNRPRIPDEAIIVECAAQVPPSFAEYALRHGASEVVVETCARDDCEYRLGDAWTRLRFAGRRKPALRPTAGRDRIRVVSGDGGADRPGGFGL